MFKKNILILIVIVIFTSILLINCKNNSNTKKEPSISSIAKSTKEKSKKENLDETKYYINKNYDKLLIICKEWYMIKDFNKEINDEIIKKKVLITFENIKNNWTKIENRKIPNSNEAENFFNELKFVKDKQLKAIEYFIKGIDSKNSEFINEGYKYLKESNKYIYSDIIPYIEEINTNKNN